MGPSGVSGTADIHAHDARLGPVFADKELSFETFATLPPPVTWDTLAKAVDMIAAVRDLAPMVTGYRIYIKCPNNPTLIPRGDRSTPA
jgi:hypothetical protein